MKSFRLGFGLFFILAGFVHVICFWLDTFWLHACGNNVEWNKASKKKVLYRHFLSNSFIWFLFTQIGFFDSFLLLFLSRIFWPLQKLVYFTSVYISICSFCSQTALLWISARPCFWFLLRKFFFCCWHFWLSIKALGI